MGKSGILNCVGLGWSAPPGIMSGQHGLWGDGVGGLQKQTPDRQFRVSIGRELRYLLAICKDTGRPNAIRAAGIAHSFGVALIEDYNMARGKGSSKDVANTGMPRFVDVKLTAEQRSGFVTWERRKGSDLVTLLQGMADDGYRVGVSWSGEQQAYTVSITGRADGNPNKGLCMTSFAKTLETALWLALYKHLEVCGEHWLDGLGGLEEEFG